MVYKRIAVFTLASMIFSGTTTFSMDSQNGPFTRFTHGFTIRSTEIFYALKWGTTEVLDGLKQSIIDTPKNLKNSLPSLQEITNLKNNLPAAEDMGKYCVNALVVSGCLTLLVFGAIAHADDIGRESGRIYGNNQ